MSDEKLWETFLREFEELLQTKQKTLSQSFVEKQVTDSEYFVKLIEEFLSDYESWLEGTHPIQKEVAQLSEAEFFQDPRVSFMTNSSQQMIRALRFLSKKKLPVGAALMRLAAWADHYEGCSEIPCAATVGTSSLTSLYAHLEEQSDLEQLDESIFQQLELMMLNKQLKKKATDCHSLLSRMTIHQSQQNKDN
jgi:hypothetical protein